MKQSLKEYGLRLSDSFPVGYVSLTITHLDKSIDFYHSMIGLHVLMKNRRTAVLGTMEGRPLIMLTQAEKATPRKSNATGMDHLAILVPDRAELARHLGRIWERDHPVAMIADHGVNESVYVNDPDGILVELTRDFTREELERHRQRSSRELGNLLLDLARQLRPAFPDISTNRKIGHILLKVSDLGQAEKFYVQALGFQVSMRIPGAVFVASGAYHHHLGFHVWDSEGGPQPDLSAMGLRYFSIIAPRDGDLRETSTTSGPVNEDLFLRDPAGNGIVLTPTPNGNPEKLMELDQTLVS